MGIVKQISLPSVIQTEKLHTVLWIPETKVRGVLQIAHGMVEYIERYEHFAAYLNKRGIAVIGHDHLGHGHTASSEKDFGYFSEKDGDRAVILDMHRVTKYARRRFPSAPIYLMGHSMGSFCTRNYMMLFGIELSGVILMGTGYHCFAEARLGEYLSAGFVKLFGSRYKSHLIDQIILGSYNRKFAPNRTHSDWISSDEKIVDQYVTDPFCTFKFTAGAYRDFFRILVRVSSKEQIRRIPKNLPIYLVSGEQDPVGNFGKGVKKVYDQFQKLGFEDVTMRLFPDARHEILNEKQKEIVFEDLARWLDNQLKAMNDNILLHKKERKWLTDDTNHYF